jgi:hypothetical protein
VPAAEASTESDKPRRVTVRLPDLDHESVEAMATEHDRQTAAPATGAPPAEPARPDDSAAPAVDATPITETAPSNALPQSPPAPLPPEVNQPASEPSPSRPDNRLLWLIGAGIGCLSILLIGTCLGLILLFNVAGILGSNPPSSPQTPALTTPRPSTDPADAYEILLTDDFSSATRSSLGSGSDSATSYRFVDGVYEMEVVPADMLAWSRIDGNYRNAQIEFDARLIDGPAETGVGLIFRYQDADNFYLFTVSGDGFYNLEMISNGRWQTLIDWTAEPAILPSGQVNRLSVTTIDERIMLVVNGVIVDETVAPHFTAGAAALAITTFEQGAATAMFDNLKIRRR